MTKIAMWFMTALTLMCLPGCGLTQDVNSTSSNKVNNVSTGNAQTGNKTANRTDPVIEAITPQPNGILVSTEKPVNQLKTLVVNPHFVPAKGHTPQQFIFTLQHVIPGSHLQFNTTQSIGTTQLRVMREGQNLIVTYMSPGVLVNRFRIGTDKRMFLAFALYNGSATSSLATKPMCNLPAWFFHDITVASKANIPMVATEYGHMLPYQQPAGYMLSAPKGEVSEQVGFSAYFGAIQLADVFTGNGTNVCEAIIGVKYGNVEEQNGSKSERVPALMVWLANGWGFGFAKNQVIVSTTHSGFLNYTIYDVPGIEFQAQTS